MGLRDSRRTKKEGEVKGKAADNPAHLLNDTAGTPKVPVKPRLEIRTHRHYLVVKIGLTNSSICPCF